MKKDKHDKKDKDDKHQKHSKKHKKHKERKDKKSSSTSTNDNSISTSSIHLYYLLNHCFLTQPKIMNDVIDILIALHKGEYIVIEYITNQHLKSFLEELMKYLPVLYNPQYGWYKDSQSTDIINSLIKHIYISNTIKLKKEDLTMSESIASTHVMMKLLLLLEKYPELVLELAPMFQNIYDGIIYNTSIIYYILLVL